MYARRWLIFWVLAIGFFALALSNDVYNVTSPPAFSWHVLLRKFYSIVAFTIVGAAYVRASGASVLRASVAIALYSGAIEIGQHVTNGREPLIWNGVDVICGGVGGALGALTPWVRAKSSARISAVQKRDRPRHV